MQRDLCVRLPIIIYFALVASVEAARIRRSIRNGDDKIYDINLLITRHGLSCTNVAQTWIGNIDAGRANIHDPLLTSAGVLGSEHNGKIVDDWLESRNWTIDAVLSSVLARAMETAFVMYPNHAVPLHVAPFIREHSSGLSNSPKENRQEQIVHLNTTLNRPFQLDYKGIDNYGIEEGTWDQFVDFLEQTFLPQLVSQVSKPSGSRIVLPVVTHSNFMRDSVVGDRCGNAWTSKGNRKPLNSQVVEMSYTFKVGNPSEDSGRFVFRTANAGQKDVDGLWVQAGKKNGRLAYKHAANSDMKIEWNAARKTWQLSTSSWFAFSRKILYHSKLDEQVVPTMDWETVKGTGPAPNIIVRNSLYNLKPADTPCEEVAPGLELKDSSDRIITPICLKDIGDICIDSIKKHSWMPGILWKKTYEGIIEQKNSQMIETTAKIESLDQEYNASVGAMSSYILRDQLKQARAKLESLQAEIPELAKAKCWTGGMPDPNRENLANIFDFHGSSP